jgi:hypothetical protein
VGSSFKWWGDASGSEAERQGGRVGMGGHGWA